MAVEMSRVKAIVFDLGGVLIDVDPGRCFRFWAEHSNTSPDDLRTRFFIDEAYERHERGEIEFSEYATHLRGQLGIELDEDLLRDGWNALLGEALPGAAGVIEQASRRYPCFLFSNSNAVHQTAWRRTQAKLLAPLHRQFVSSELGLRKPEARAYQRVAELTGFAPAELLFFDDLAENITAAHDVGFQAVRVSGPGEILAHIACR
jgi:glucose-1-phosphatase